MTEPKGQPKCLFETVERVPSCSNETSVLARSANDGSGTGGIVDAGLLVAC